MAKFCAWCGKPSHEGDVFCAWCGKRVDGGAAPADDARRTGGGTTQQQAYAPRHAAQRKGAGGLVAGCAAAALVIAVVIGGFVWPGFFKKSLRPAAGAPAAAATEEPASANTPKPTEKPKETTAPATAGTPKETAAPDGTPDQTPAPAEEPAYENTFTDVKESDWFYDAVCWAGKNGVVSGTEFKPNEQSSRAQLLTFLWRAAGEPKPGLKESPFSDVKESDWYYQAVLWAYETGIVSDSDDGRLRADGKLTRAQAVTFLCRAKGGSAKSAARAFADVKEDAWYFEAANWALENGLVGRGGSWFFDPDGVMTRAQVTTLMYRAFDPGAKKADAAAPEPEGFRELGISENVDDHGSKTFATITDADERVTVSVEVTDYRIFESDNAMPKIDGCEYRVMTMKLTCADARSYKITVLCDDYYNTLLFADSEMNDRSGAEIHTVVVNGAPAECRLWWDHSSENRDGLHIVYLTWTASVPKGYDGVVVGVRNRELKSSGLYLDQYYTSEEDFALYRLK